jgi:hypothetical protein
MDARRRTTDLLPHRLTLRASIFRFGIPKSAIFNAARSGEKIMLCFQKGIDSDFCCNFLCAIFHSAGAIW